MAKGKEKKEKKTIDAVKPAQEKKKKHDELRLEIPDDLPRDEFVGKLIVFEGIRGSGKTTQMHLLDVFLQNSGAATYVSTKESSKLVSKLIKRAKDEQLLDTISYNLAFAADMADRLERDLIPSLNSGLVVFSERYILDLLAHGVVRGTPIEWLNRIYDFAPKPNITIYIDLDPRLAMSRLRNSEITLDHYSAGKDFTGIKSTTESFLVYQSKLREFFLDRIKNDKNVVVIDGRLPIPQQQQKIRKAIIASLSDYLSHS